MKFSPQTPFAERVARALIDAGLDQARAAELLSAQTGRKIKPQTVQHMTSKAKSSALVADVEAITGFSAQWLLHGTGEPRRQIDTVTSQIADLMRLSTPRSHAALERIQQAMNDGQLTEADIALLASIAERFQKK